MHIVRRPREHACTRLSEGGWCGACYTNIRGRTAIPTHLGYRSKATRRRAYVESPMKKPSGVQEKSVASCGCPDPAWVKAYPHICEMLVTSAWDDGTSREPSAVTISIRDGAVQVAVNDKALKCSAYSSAGSVQEALKLMEAALKDGLPIWRPWKVGKGK